MSKDILAAAIVASLVLLAFSSFSILELPLRSFDAIVTVPIQAVRELEGAV